MDLIKAEIERKRRQLESKEILQPKAKCFKRSDLILKQKKDYRRKHQQQQVEPDYDSPSEAVELEEKPAPLKANDKSVKDFVPSRSEVISRLRARNEPIRLFGETDTEAFERLKMVELMKPEAKEGMRNDFKFAMDKVTEQYILEAADVKSRKVDVQVRKYSTWEELQGRKKQLSHSGQGLYDGEIVQKFFKLILGIWGDELNKRTLDEKNSPDGRLANATYRQTVDYMKPLLRKLQDGTLDFNQLECLTEIVRHMLNKEYIKANNAYVEMAIGNSPWPIGVTMVGIHSRPGREKVHSRHIAHVLNDETQRKYIQAVKRLLSKCQEFFPTALSKSVNVATSGFNVYDKKH